MAYWPSLAPPSIARLLQREMCLTEVPLISQTKRRGNRLFCNETADGLRNGRQSGKGRLFHKIAKRERVVCYIKYIPQKCVTYLYYLRCFRDGKYRSGEMQVRLSVTLLFPCFVRAETVTVPETVRKDCCLPSRLFACARSSSYRSSLAAECMINTIKKAREGGYRHPSSEDWLRYTLVHDIGA